MEFAKKPTGLSLAGRHAHPEKECLDCGAPAILLGALSEAAIISGSDRSLSPDEEVAEILTPRAPAEPRINGRGSSRRAAGSPFSFHHRGDGAAPDDVFGHRFLPEGLTLDAEAWVESRGMLAKAGEFVVTLRATNALGSAERNLKIVAGVRSHLTPPMGWNS